MSLARWRRIAGESGPIRTSGKGRQIHMARAKRDTVEAALENLAQLLTTQSAKRAVADTELADAARRLLRYGPAASALTGWPLAELRQLVGGRGSLSAKRRGSATPDIRPPESRASELLAPSPPKGRTGRTGADPRR
jgi:hypothetical protein